MMDEVRKEIEAGEISVPREDGTTFIIKMSPELQKAMKRKLDRYDRFMKAKFKRVFKKNDLLEEIDEKLESGELIRLPSGFVKRK